MIVWQMVPRLVHPLVGSCIWCQEADEFQLAAFRVFLLSASVGIMGLLTGPLVASDEQENWTDIKIFKSK